MKLARTTAGPVLERNGQQLILDDSWDSLVCQNDPVGHLQQVDGTPTTADVVAVAPIVGQEVWAAGVTYYVSREARMEESAAAGTPDIYERCYAAERPELFFKATPHRVAGPGQPVRIRADSMWNVPEPELTLAIASNGTLFGYTIGNDMSSRDIEGENPLYLPQAKTYDGSAALGPVILISAEPQPPDTAIRMSIARAGTEVCGGATEVGRI
jgi:2-dehydro-3-deoxy-D-arabinonate dehydratase